ALVEIKTLDDAYPLFGTLDLIDADDQPIAKADAFDQSDGRWGVAVDALLLERLGLSIGDTILVGDLATRVTATIAREPDRMGSSGITLGPRLMMADAALEDTGLVQPGSQLYYHYRLGLPDGTDVTAYIADLNERFPEAGWRVRDFTDAAPRLEQLIRRLALFLTLAGLTALLVGGVGVGNAVRSFLEGRMETIATLKCLGAPGRLIFAIYLMQVLAVASIGIAIGLVFGALAPLMVGGLLSGILSVGLDTGLHVGALIMATCFGVLTALTFSLWPLGRAQRTRAGALFRDLYEAAGERPSATVIIASVLSVVALAALTILTADDRAFAMWFVAASIAAFILLRLLGEAVVILARRAPRAKLPSIRLAVANLHRPGTPTGAIVLSLGLGLTVLVTVASIEGNISRQVTENLPEDAPAFFFIDIRPDAMERFAQTINAVEGAGDVRRVPSLRGRIVAVNDVPAQEALVDESEAWLLRGDRGLTYAAEQEQNHVLAEGEWWPDDYAGPPLVSIVDDVVEAFAIGIGDRITISALGREFTAEVANIRDVDWSSMGINFAMVFSPQPLASAPHTFLATAQAASDVELDLQRQITQDFPNVTTVRMREALETVNGVIRQIGTAVRAIAALALLAGTLVLAGAIAAGHRRRVYDSVVLKVLGATRGRVMAAYLLEYGLLGLVTAAVAAIIGTVAGWSVITQIMQADWVFLPGAITGTALICMAITIGLGLVGTWRALGQRAAPLLRNE
ncbi:MAG: FtsX-like permease family protein, partial [Pseudomonadota bacterium]